MNAIEELLENSAEVEKRLGVVFKDKKLFIQAFVHRSFFNENRILIAEHNERLEFLGDSVLGLIISDYLYTKLPDVPEGRLSYLRSQIVEAGRCVEFIQQLDVISYVLLGRGERMNDGRGRDTILADLFEAIIGSIYLDQGLEEVKRFFFSHFAEEIDRLILSPQRNWKAELQDYSQKKHQKPPFYQVLKEIGPDHSKIFHVVVFVDEILVGEGEGSSKKEAEQIAAENALKQLIKGE
ncbi:MAG: ribonuclease III [Chlamydiales bacterium]|nr:ribonuclease III [Chlamydiales bacterium]